MKYFHIRKGQNPTVAERALMLMVENHEAFPRIIRFKDGEKMYYKILIH